MNYMSIKVFSQKKTVLNSYKSKVDEKCELALHLLNQTKERLRLFNERKDELNKMLSELKTRFDCGYNGRGVIVNVYGKIKSIEATLFELNKDLQVIQCEYDRRNKEYKALMSKSIGLKIVIEKCEAKILTLNEKLESSLIDEWVTSRHSAKF